MRSTTSLIDFTLAVDDQTDVRPLRIRDAEELFELTVRNRTTLARWMAWIDNIERLGDTLHFVQNAEREGREQTSFKTGIRHDGALVGCIDLHNLDWPNRVAHVGYWLDLDCNGRGIMTRSVRALTDYAFQALDLNRIEIRCATENERSRAVPLRVGYQFEGILREAQQLRGAFLDHAIYAMLRRDWKPPITA